MKSKPVLILRIQYGLPLLIDLADCDCLFPSEFDVHDRASQPYLGFQSMISLSIILGKVQKLMYTPSMFQGSYWYAGYSIDTGIVGHTAGIMGLTDDMVASMMLEIEE